MTDRDKLKQLLNHFNIEYSIEESDIICHSGYKKIKGYFGFFTCFTFDDKGLFLDMGAYE